MKEGIGIQELAREVQRRSTAKRDFIVKTKDLGFFVTPIMEEAEAIVGGGPALVSVDGGRHQASAEWWNAQLGNTTSTALAVRPTQYTTGLTIPTGRLVDGARTVEPLHLGINALAHDQLASHLHIPSVYYNRLLTDYPVLLGENVNTLLHDASAKESRMVRSLDGVARAFLSDAYEPLDNWDLMRFLMPLFAPRDTRLTDGSVIKHLTNPDGSPLDVQFRSTNITDESIYIKLVVPSLTAEIKVGQTVRAGVIIGNSEVGLGSIYVYPFYEVLQCTNGAYITEFGNKRRHVGGRKGGDIGSTEGNDAFRFFSSATKRANDKAFFLKMADVVRGTLTEATFNRMLEPMREAMGVSITGHPEAALEVAGRMLDISEGEQDDIMRYLIDGGDLSMWGLSNAVTRYSQDVASYDRATELERAGGDIITLAPSEWKTIAEATKKPRRAQHGTALQAATAARTAGLV